MFIIPTWIVMIIILVVITVFMLLAYKFLMTIGFAFIEKGKDKIEDLKKNNTDTESDTKAETDADADTD